MGDDLVEVEAHPLDREHTRPQPRDFEDLVDEPQEPVRARRDDLDQPPLLVVERTRDPVAQEVRAFTDRRERRAQLVGHRREELLLGVLHPPELPGHRAEGARELTDLVPSLDRDGLLERARGNGRGGGRQLLERLGETVRDEPASEQCQPDRGAERDEDARPGARLQTRDLGLGLQDVRVHRLGQRLQVRLDALGERPRRAFRQGRRAGALTAAEERLDLTDCAVVALERFGGFVQKAHLLRARRVFPQADETHAQAFGALVPGTHEARIVEDEGACFETNQRGHGIPSRRRQAQRGDGPGGDLTVDGGETADRAEAQHADRAEHHDDRRRR